jgi:hypothetical protein
MGPFRAEDGGIGVDLDDTEREFLARLLTQAAEMLDPADDSAQDRDPLARMLGLDPSSVPADDADQDTGPSPGPEDPAVARLLPSGHREDPEMSAEFRRLTEYGLRLRKGESLRVAESALRRADPPLLTEQEAQSLVKGLTDIRLVLGQRLGLNNDADAERLQEILVTHGDDEQHPLAGVVLMYDLLTWWQEHLVTVLQEIRERS